MGLWDRLKGRGGEQPPKSGTPGDAKDAAAVEWVPRLTREAQTHASPGESPVPPASVSAEAAARTKPSLKLAVDNEPPASRPAPLAAMPAPQPTPTAAPQGRAPTAVNTAPVKGNLAAQPQMVASAAAMPAVHADPQPAAQIPAPPPAPSPAPSPSVHPSGKPLGGLPPAQAIVADRLLQSYRDLRAAYRTWDGDCLAGVVADAMRDRLAVLWLGMGDVVLAGDRESLRSPHATTVRDELQRMYLTFRGNQVVADGVIKELRDVMFSTTTRRQAGTNGEPLDRDTYLLRIYDDLILAAIKVRASDIHFSFSRDEFSSQCLIALRMHGRFRPWRRDIHTKLVQGLLGASFGKRLVANTNSKPQLTFDSPVAYMTRNVGPDAVIWTGRCNGRKTRGYRMVIRLLENTPAVDRVPTLEELGYVPSHQQILETAVKRNFGVIVIFGSTGSGKSTTLRTFMVRVTDPTEQAVYSVENPVEYEMPGVEQISLPVDVEATSDEIASKFVAALRDIMRMDPDVLMVGEIRDKETGKLVSEFSQTGHRCYTTCHGDGAVDGIQRMCGTEIGMPAELFAGSKFLSAAIYQRLLPRLCAHCRIPATDPKVGLSAAHQRLLREKFRLDPGTMYVANETGCPHCMPNIPGLAANGTKGVIVAPEVLVPTADMREQAGRRDWAGLMKAWRTTRRTGFGDGDMTGKTAFECALYLAAQGKVSIRDIETEFEPLDSYEIFPTADDVQLRGVSV